MRKEKKLLEINNHHIHHKHEDVLKLLNIAKGHIQGVIEMILEDKYCIDISKQILAVISLLKKVNLEVLKKHLETCVLESKEKGEFEIKIKELEDILSYIMKTKGD